MRHQRQREEDHDTGDRQQDQRREHARNVEPVARFGDPIGEARTGPRRACGDLGDDGADQRQSAGDPQAAEDERKRRRQLEPPQQRQPRGAVKGEQIGEIAIDRIEPQRGIGEHRKERHDPGAGQHRRRLRQIDEQQRRDRHHRRDLEDDGVRVERLLDQAGLVEQDRKRDAAENGENETPRRSSSG